MKIFEKDYYSHKGYLNQNRIQAYVEQYKYINNGDDILEVGNAGGVFGNLASKIANYNSLDISPNTNPDIIADISNKKLLYKINNKYDVVFCCEVLEHIPFNRFEQGIENIMKIANKTVIISLPDNRKFIRVLLFFIINIIKKAFSIPFTGKEVNLNVNNGHHFEINSKNINKIKKIMNKIAKTNFFYLKKDYRLFDRPYQHFFIFEKDYGRVIEDYAEINN